MLLKSIKHMQVHIIQYRNAGDDEIETFRITITSHRWSWVNIYKFTEWTLGPKIVDMRSCSSTQVEEILAPQGSIKGDRSGPQLWAERGAQRQLCRQVLCTKCTYRGHNNNNSRYIVLCTLICTIGGPSVHQHSIW